MKYSQKIALICFASFFLITGLAACGKQQASPTPTVIPTAAVTPTATEPPAALTVNGISVTLDEYQQELTRLQQAQTELGITSTPEEQKQKVIDSFTEQLLMAQGAQQAGFTVDDATLQARIEVLIAEIGGADKLSAWMTANNYTEATFQQAMRRSIAVAWQRDQIANSVPTTADQVHARQILVQTEDTANLILSKLEGGADFATLALQYDPTTGGDLGWFPKGYLTQPEVESAAFSLEANQNSEIIHTSIGYHILYIIERDPNHVLSPDARRVLQEAKITEWLDASKAASTITVKLP